MSNANTLLSESLADEGSKDALVSTDDEDESPISTISRIPFLPPPYLARKSGQEFRRGVNFVVCRSLPHWNDAFFEERGINKSIQEHILLEINSAGSKNSCLPYGPIFNDGHGPWEYSDGLPQLISNAIQSSNEEDYDPQTG
ncbi:hypothetical protein HHK36_032591 [Tetracentron sinense]|uniref:Uncharacterized protein n=1 Tax=Tetracentron sinense TaxID=13715 RepID=A0A834Y7V4_TETSI|nr:hypothetical protein HHK36_032591 [Tetracentron sinense]